MIAAVCSLLTQPARSQDYHVTPDEARNLALEIDSTMNRQDPKILNQLVDQSTLLSRIHLEMDPNIREQYMAGLAKGLNIFNLGNKCLTGMGDGSYRFLRQYNRDAESHILFRMLGASGLNYHDFTLVRIRDSVKAADVLIFLSGEDISKTMSNMAMALDPSRYSESEINLMTKFMHQVGKADFVAARQSYEQFPDRLREEKYFQMINLQVCQHIDKQLYKSALIEFMKKYPNAPNAALTLIDLYLLNKEYDSCLSAIDRLDSLVHGDPVLNFLRGNVLKKTGKDAESTAYYQKAFDYDPVIWQNMQQLVMAYMTGHQLEKAKSVIATYEKTAYSKKQYVDDLKEKYPDLK